MSKAENTLSETEITDSKARRFVAAHLQTIEGSPPTAEQSAMFEMFERERWPHAKRLAYIRQRAEAAAVVHAAE